MGIHCSRWIEPIGAPGIPLAVSKPGKRTGGIMGIGYSHVGLATHDMNATIAFYQGVLGFRRVAEQRTRVKEGGSVRLTYFDAGGEQFMVFMESRGVDGIPNDFDTGINRTLGVPLGMYHFAFKAGSEVE